MNAIELSWDLKPTNVSSRLFGLGVVDANVIWAVGDTDEQKVAGAVVRTIDGGRNWENVTPPGGDLLDFHDVHPFSRDRAVALAAGQGKASKIFLTANGGASWELAFENQDRHAFYDGIAFFDSRRGLAVSDPVRGKFPVLLTADGGRTWSLAPNDRMPPARDEAVRASGTSLVAVGPNDAWFGTAPGAARPDSRVFITHDGGRSWTTATAPIPGAPEFGVASLAFRDRLNGMAIGGGDFVTDEPDGVAAITIDGGTTWSRVGSLSGFRLNAVWVPADSATIAVAVGPFGSDFTTDGGRTWRRFDETSLRGVNSLPAGSRGGSLNPQLEPGDDASTCWAVGDNGTAAELVVRRV